LIGFVLKTMSISEY